VRGRLTIAGIMLAGCLDRPDTYIVPLAELDAEVQLVEDDRFSFSQYMIRIVADRDPCLVLSPRDTRTTVDGVEGTMDMGHPEYSNRPCYGPAMMFDSVADMSGPSTITLSDSSATWTFVMWQPFKRYAFEPVSPPPPPDRDTPLMLRVGETVTMRLDGFNGTITSISARASIDYRTEVFELDDASGVTVSGDEISFVVPDTPTAMAQLEVSAEYDVRIDRCDAPRGCRPQADQPAFFRVYIVIEP
jgi:hypothetical protein